MNDDAPRRPVLRDLPLVPRLVIAVFLMSVGVGYFSALVQLHFQAASPGKVLPDMDDAARIYNGDPNGKSQLERLLSQEENLPFNGSGSMRAAFTARSSGWKGQINKRAKEELKEKQEKGEKDAKLDLPEAEKHLRGDRDGERLALLAWIRAGAPEKAFESNDFELAGVPDDQPITARYLIKDAEENPVKPHRVRIQNLLDDRCVRCHKEGGQVSDAPLETYDDVKSYCDVEARGHAMSLTKLAQTTHVHLLGFSMLYGLTGLIFAFTSYPGWMRFVLAPLPLLAQVADISCWWLGRLDPQFAHTISITGGIVAAGLFLHIVLSLFNMFSWRGWLVLILLFGLAGFGGFTAYQKVIDPFLQQESKGQVLER
jgi:hypothetical protein